MLYVVSSSTTSSKCSICYKSLLIIIYLLSIIIVTNPVFAEDSNTPQTSKVNFNIAAGNLISVLNSFASDAGITLSFDAADLEGRYSNGIKGNYSTEEAIHLLLKDTELSVSRTSSGGYIISKLDKNEIKEISLQPILVKGELQERTLQDSQTSVAVITGEELERRSDTSVRTVVERTAGISTSASGVGFVIRGIDERGVDANSSAAAAISTSLDGFRLTDFERRSTSFLSTWDLEQIEVLRGPQSTQAGRNALAGAVVLRSKDPTFESEAKIRGGLGDFDSEQLAFALNQPIIEDKLAVRLTGEYDRTDGFVENNFIGDDEEGELENKNIRGSIRFDPTEKISSVLKLSYIKSLDGGRFSDPEFLPDAETDNDADSFTEGQYRTANLRISYDVSSRYRMESETTYANRDFFFSGDFDGGPEPSSAATDSQNGESFSQELKLLYSDQRTNAVVGAFYTNINQSSARVGTSRVSDIFPIAPPTLFADGGLLNKTDVENYAVFGEVDFDIIPSIRLILGGRYDYEENDEVDTTFSTINDPAFAFLLPPSNETVVDSDYSEFLPKAGLVYSFNDDVSLGFTYQRGYRAGGSSFNLIQSQQFAFDPEFTNNYELAFRSQWFNDRLTVNANAYFTDYKDQQVEIQLDPANDLDVITTNAGESESYGAELEFRAQIGNDIEMYGSFGYNNTEFKDFLFNGEQLAGNEFRNAPEYTGSVGVDYFHSSGIFAGGSLSYTSGSFGNALNTPESRSGSRGLINVQAGYETDQFSIFGYVDNLTDKHYLENTATVGDPRTYGILGQIYF